MGLKLYHYSVSGPSRAAYMTIKAIGLEVEVVIVDLMKQEQLKENFLQINPQHCVPTIDDDGFVLWESKAIACYLAEKHGRDDLYPKDLKHRALVNQRLYFDSATLLPHIRAIMHPILFQNVKEIKKPLKDNLYVQLGFLNGFLSESKWVAGNELTVADISLASSMATVMFLLQALDWDLSNLPNIGRWFKQCENIPGFEENLKGAKLYGDAVKRNLQL
ncbi:glutathione S-transferase 1 isoform X1 [Pieris rapae]|uniref:glutathione S-transferase 1 isoform X1 n=1 Tax=Pieris rapae TaxID=64459 RepID=UPI001E281A24|nr:glutathione S-transferase 1 isoform X1 [Pieris rapae]